MQSKIHRLHLRSQRDFFQSSSKVYTPSVQWFVGKETQSTFTVACIVPKAIVKKATERNSLKRRIYQYLSSSKSVPNRPLAAIVRRRNLTSQDIYESLSILCSRIGTNVSAN